MPRKRPRTKGSRKRQIQVKQERRLKKKGLGVGALIRGQA